MASQILNERNLDALLLSLEVLKEIPELADIVNSFLKGEYRNVLLATTSQKLFNLLSENVANSKQQQQALLGDLKFDNDIDVLKVFITGLAALDAFFQVNVTGPVLNLRGVFPSVTSALNERFLRSLDVDGVSVYQHIPHIELFCLARLVFTVFFPRIVGGSGDLRDSKWTRLRINAFHQRLLAGVSVGRLIDGNLLQDVIERDLETLEKEIFSESTVQGGKQVFGRDERVMFLLEKAHIYISEGLELKGKESVQRAGKEAGFVHQLSGALGKRTRFQQKDISQLVVLAKSSDAPKEQRSIESQPPSHDGPQALDLNDDTVLENIAFAKKEANGTGKDSSLPAELADLQPDEQPQLHPLDQINLLTEATLKDTLSPLDKLNSEEILPYAVRVLSDKPTNWQIYTQALLVRSRIESHRSRTMERSVLQLQVIVDQIIADTQEASAESSGEKDIPEITVTQFFPRAKANESAPIQERLKYIFQLNTPTRWELETELAFAWSQAGSFISALEIFKRLKLWPEVALCYHSVNQESKARQIVRRQLFESSRGREVDEFGVDAKEVIEEQWDGPERTPAPAHAPRLWCILGDLDQNPEFWIKAWEISKHRYARAQRTLGDYYSKQGELDLAREAYLQATIVNRQNNDTWSRLGDIDLAVGNWNGAIIAFQQAIMIDDTDAKTYSNLGSALLSKHNALLALQKASAQDLLPTATTKEREDEEEDALPSITPSQKKESPRDILIQALTAFKRGASLAHDNWKIWDNVITISGRLSPPSFPDLILALRAVIRIRAPTIGEEAIDVDVLRGLVQEVTSRERPENSFPGEKEEDNDQGIYTPPRGTLARVLVDMVDDEIVPLITTRAELWVLVEKLKLYRKDYKAALACAERAWRMRLAEGGGEKWLLEEKGWKEVVEMTDHLVSAFENYAEGNVNWKAKARSAIRGVMGKGRDSWEGSEGWEALEGLLEGLKN